MTDEFIPRALARTIDDALADTPVVCLLGPRQCGKSTLAARLDPNRLLVSLDESRYLDVARSDPDGFVSSPPRYVTIDEVQRAPEIPRAIKRSVDRDRTPGRFLLTGSANLLLLSGVDESLAGRMEIVRRQCSCSNLFSPGVRRAAENFIDWCARSSLRQASLKQGSISTFRRYGGRWLGSRTRRRPPVAAIARDARDLDFGVGGLCGVRAAGTRWSRASTCACSVRWRRACGSQRARRPADAGGAMLKPGGRSPCGVVDPNGFLSATVRPVLSSLSVTRAWIQTNSRNGSAGRWPCRSPVLDI